jgi:ATP-dependent DNA helicase DinG
MLSACAQVIEEGGTLLVEAPTGVGKTLAYLVPILLSGQKAIISTKTINLQEQLFHKDLPLLAQLLNFDFALAKGFSNYLCLLFWEEFLTAKEDAVIIKYLRKWVRKTQTGDREELELEPRIWEEICADSNACLRRDCDFYDNCFYFLARKRWKVSEVLVANHALVAMDAAMFSIGLSEELLPKADILVLDEAHRLDEVFSEITAFQLTQLGLERLIGKLIGRKRKREGEKEKEKEKEKRGLLHHELFYDEALVAQVEVLRSQAERFFSDLREFFPEPCKVRVLPQPHDQSFPPSLRQDLEILGNTIGSLGSKLEALRRVHPLHRGSSKEEKHQVARLNQSLRTLENLGQAAAAFLKEEPQWVQWVEVLKKRAALVTSPLYPAEMVQKYLIPRYRTVILTSATLSVDGDFSFIQEKLGFRGVALSLNSSFNYHKQAKLFIKDLIPPKEGELTEEYLDDLAWVIEKITQGSKGGALVLFTSWKALEGVESRLSKLPCKLLIQGRGPRHKLLEEFKADGNAVLLGTGSFWEGIDVPGPALRTLIITKLPFEVPNDPIHQARMEDLKAKGQNPFMEYVLPQAILKFKQGFGRLIRTSQDKGVVWVLDGRLITKAYGRRFLNSLPKELEVFLDQGDNDHT